MRGVFYFIRWNFDSLIEQSDKKVVSTAVPREFYSALMIIVTVNSLASSEFEAEVAKILNLPPIVASVTVSKNDNVILTASADFFLMNGDGVWKIKGGFAPTNVSTGKD